MIQIASAKLSYYLGQSINPTFQVKSFLQINGLHNN